MLQNGKENSKQTQYFSANHHQCAATNCWISSSLHNTSLSKWAARASAHMRFFWAARMLSRLLQERTSSGNSPGAQRTGPEPTLAALLHLGKPCDPGEELWELGLLDEARLDVDEALGTWPGLGPLTGERLEVRPAAAPGVLDRLEQGATRGAPGTESLRPRCVTSASRRGSYGPRSAD
eukprot:TRINITY_DN47625_c0_g1_i1.p1 TRINITY_DN47625_c0_g1~~TRINITY_DN47625_c0_g1_i1.p1  ORF type:complete len:179 (+),score=22.79 TRINITY_DN47625_c0_g1_i1:103-639(+)